MLIALEGYIGKELQSNKCVRGDETMQCCVLADRVVQGDDSL